MSDTRWIVETKRDEFDDVGADRVAVESGGVLAFYNTTQTAFEDIATLAIAYAPGAWLTVTEGDK